MPSVDILYRLRKQRPDVFDKVEGMLHHYLVSDLTDMFSRLVYIDGGIRRGTGKYVFNIYHCFAKPS